MSYIMKYENNVQTFSRYPKIAWKPHKYWARAAEGYFA